ncbi:TolC family outer membrane protein [Histidinibacterium aquaticum]|uniref:TolC family outer membrane protein n=1 Tax=Histidinibacterium aquaticum TaxID=2613962 RepID=A0A5J5GPC5_9RHOB|nr:TolC family outer membrane protein [Histidinibacterium aquaticum]KAA9010189.1 TolC family outer membrane protein [Histidinibacterium aquaticum]
MQILGRAAAIAFALSLGFAAPAARAQSLADTLMNAYESSGLLTQNRALLRAADEDVAQAVSQLAPIISWTANAQVTDPRPIDGDFLTTSLGLSAQLLIYDGGATQTAIAAQKETVLATRAELRGIEQDVLLRAVEAHLNIRRASEFVQLRRNNVRLITEQLRAARDRFEVGEVTRTDVSLAEARLASARGNLASAEGDLAQAIEEYIAAVGTRPGTLGAVQPAQIGYDQAAAKAFAVRNHPSIEAAQHQVAAAELNIQRAEAALRPNVNLQGNIGLDDDFNSTESLSLSLSGPISQGGRLASSIRQAMARRDAARAGLHISRQQIEQQVGNAYALLAVARASAEATDRQVRAAQVAFDGVREEATLGARTTLDVLDAEQELFDARTALISAQIDATLATYRVLAAMGLLTVDRLNLGIQTYDPAAYYNLVEDAPLGQSDRGRALDRVLRSIGD